LITTELAGWSSFGYSQHVCDFLARRCVSAYS